MKKKETSVRERGFHGAVGTLTAELLAPMFQKKDFLYSRLALDWPSLVGEDWACWSYPIKIGFSPQEEGVLHLAVCDGKALELGHRTYELIARLNQYFGYAAITRVMLKRTRFMAQHTRSSSHHPPPSHFENAPLPQEIAHKLESVKEERLKKNLHTLGIAVFSSKK